MKRKFLKHLLLSVSMCALMTVPTTGNIYAATRYERAAEALQSDDLKASEALTISKLNKILARYDREPIDETKDRTVSRIELAGICYDRTDKKDTKDESLADAYKDVKDDDKKLAAWAVSHKILKGLTKTALRPDAAATCLMAETAADRLFHAGMRADDITPDELIESVKNVKERARTSGWVYGNSHSSPPCEDGKIACDRLEARALWDLGFTDQNPGGISIYTMDGYLVDHGFEKGTDWSDIKYGSIVLYCSAETGEPVHAFTVVSYDPATNTRVCYDTGSDSLIRTPGAESLPMQYGRNLYGVYNIPED